MTQEGHVLGEHEGLPFYTIGQRKGIKVGGGPALYVNKMDRISNALIVGSEEDLFANRVRLRDLNFLQGKPPEPEARLVGRVRSQGKLIPLRLHTEGKGQYEVEFLKPEKGLMPGQSVVIYQGKELLGGGIMCYN